VTVVTVLYSNQWLKCKSRGGGTVPAHLGSMLVVGALVESCGLSLGVRYAMYCITNSGQKGIMTYRIAS